VIRTALVLAAFLVFTPWYAALIIGASLLGVPYREGSVLAWGPRAWSRKICWAAGVRVETHGNFGLITSPAPRVIVANHVSWFDVFALASVLPRFAFVAKAELRKIPLFGPSAEASGQVFIERANRKAAFAEYEKAAERIGEGTTVVIFPEGTRGSDYPLRRFKKGPFVLAISAQAPVVPVLVHGSIEVLKKGDYRVRAGVIHIHVLDPIPTTGMTYDERDKLARLTYAAMARAQEELYGIRSPEFGS